MAKTKAQNLTRLNESLSGPEIEWLNGHPGLGDKVRKLLDGNKRTEKALHDHATALNAAIARLARGEKVDPSSLPSIEPLSQTEALTADEIRWLNGSPGTGLKVHKLISNLGNIQAAQAGHSGTVVLAQQKSKDAKGKQPDSMQLQGGRIGDAAPALRDDQYVTLGQMKRMLSCDSLVDQLRDCFQEHVSDLLPPTTPQTATTSCVAPALTLVGQADIPDFDGHPDSFGPSRQVVISGDYLYYVKDNGHVLDVWFIRNALAPQFVTSLNLHTAFFITGHRVQVQSNLLFFGGESDPGLGIVNILDPNNPEFILEADITHADITGSFRPDGFVARGTWCFLSGDSTSVSGNVQVVVLDIGNPGDPRAVSVTTINDAGGIGYLRAIAEHNNYLFVARGQVTAGVNKSLHVFRIEDPLSSATPTCVHISAATQIIPDFGGIEDIWIDGRYLYAVGDLPGGANARLLIYDIVDPESPSLVGQLDLDGTDMAYIVGQGDHVYITGLDEAIFQVDVSDRTAPATIASAAGGDAGATSGVGFSKGAIQGNHLWATAHNGSGHSEPNELQVYYIGGTLCENFEGAQLWAYERVSTDTMESRKAIVREQLVTRELYVNHIANFGGARVFWIHGSPEGDIVAPPGSMALNVDSDFDGNPTLWIKETGYADVGWISK